MDEVTLKSFINHTLGENFIVCTGCAACAAICQESCISMESDSEGFLQPNIDLDQCVDCGLCRKVCPVNNEKAKGTSPDKDKMVAFPSVWAAWNLDEEIRLQSSSGGVFSVLAKNILQKGGVVVGAAFDEKFGIHHIIIKDIKELHQLRGSKYAQSSIDPLLYEEIKKMLKEDRLVLFSGVPCQVAGLRSGLKKTYANLFCCDIICHGVPSPKLWKRYLAETEKKRGQVKKISFRHKKTGWKRYSISLEFSGGKSHTNHFFQDPYMKAFLSGIALRNSCYTCQFTQLSRQGDLTLADFWRVAKKYPEYDVDDKGTSLIIVNNQQGERWLEENRPELFLGKADLETAVSGNPRLIRPATRPLARDRFFHDFEDLDCKTLKRQYSLGPPSLSKRMARGIRRRIKRLLVK